MRELENYLNGWNQFRQYCEKRAKDSDCYINNKGWQKLREFHLENHLNNLANPFGFLYNIRIRHRRVFSEAQCMSKFYYIYLRKRQLELDSPALRVVQFPSWRSR